MVGARRASIMVYDEARGRAPDRRGARVRRRGPRAGAAWTTSARSRRGSTGSGGSSRTTRRAGGAPADCGGDRGYRGQAFLSVPICYGAPGSPLRCVGVINLTDRIGGDRFTLSDRKLVDRGRQPDRRGGGERPAGRARPPAAAAPPGARAGARPPAQAAPVARGAAGRRARWPRAASRRNRWAATSTPSPAWAAAAWASCWATSRRTDSRPRW